MYLPYFFFPIQIGISMKSEEETIADMLELGLSHGKYQALLNKLKASNAVCYPSLQKVKDAKKRLFPEGLIVKPGECIMPMQSILDSQLYGLLGINHKVMSDLAKLAGDPNVKAVTFWFKDGADSSTANKQYQTKDKLVHSSIFTTFIAPVSLQVTWKDGRKKKDLWLNEMGNSAYGVSYLRMALEKEDEGN